MQIFLFGLIGVALLFVSILLSTLTGAFVGGVVGGVFPKTFSDVLIVGILRLPPSVEMWQIGAILGFVGAFFHSTVTSKNPNS